MSCLILASLYKRSREVVKEVREGGVGAERLSKEGRKQEIREGSGKERRGP